MTDFYSTQNTDSYLKHLYQKLETLLLYKDYGIPNIQ